MSVDCPSHLNISGCPRVGEPAANGLGVAGEDLSCSSAVAMKVWTGEALTDSHRPPHIISLQLCNCLLSSVLTYIHEESKMSQI